MADDEIEDIVNACDAGREGELIFAYVYDTAEVKKPVQRLWLSLDDQAAIAEAFDPAAPRRRDEAARGRRALALGGRLAGGHERHPRGVHPAARGLRRRRVAGPRADADARARRAPRGGDPRLQARALLARGGALRGERGAPLRRPLPRRQAPAGRGGRGQDRRRPAAGSPARSRSSRRRRSASARSSSTTSPPSSATPTRSTASPRGARWRPPSASTRSTRRSPTRVRTRAS